MKIKPKQVPPEVVKALLRAWDCSTSVQPDALIAAAINAWPKPRPHQNYVYKNKRAIMLLVPRKEPGDAE